MFWLANSGPRTWRVAVHVHVLAQGRGRPVIGDAARGQGLVHEAVDGIAHVGTGAVQGTVAQDGIRQAVHGLVILDIDLAGLLAAPVEAAGLAVDIERAGKDVAPGTGPAAGLQDHDVAHHVEAGRIHGALVGFADVGDARVVEDHLGPFHGGLHAVLVQDAAHHHLLVVTQPGRRTHVHDGHVVPGIGELVTDMRSQKTGTAENSHLHGLPPDALPYAPAGRAAACQRKTESMP